MPTYIVQVKNTKGKVSKEKVEATSPAQSREMLRQQYPAIGKVSEAGMQFDFSGIEGALSKVSVKDKAVFSRQFSVMINAGVAIVRCLGVLSDQATNPKMKKALSAISAEVQQGISLSDALDKHPDCFDQLYVSMVEAGEMGGYSMKY